MMYDHLMAQNQKTNFRNRGTGKVVKLPYGYADETHPFYSQFELLGDEYEEDKVVIEGDPDEARPAGNASREAWSTYASALGHDVPDEMSRDEIKALTEEKD